MKRLRLYMCLRQWGIIKVLATFAVFHTIEYSLFTGGCIATEACSKGYHSGYGLAQYCSESERTKFQTMSRALGQSSTTQFEERELVRGRTCIDRVSSRKARQPVV